MISNGCFRLIIAIFLIYCCLLPSPSRCAETSSSNNKNRERERERKRERERERDANKRVIDDRKDDALMNDSYTSTTIAPPALPQRAAAVGADALNHLMNTMFDNYHKELVPIRPTTVKMDLLLLKVKSTVEKEGIFESVIALFISWVDNRLLWDPRHYNNVTMLAFDSDKIWLPDIAMTNSADHLYSISKDTRFVVRVSHDGTMKFVPTGTSRTWCDLKLLEFPFDIQTCTFEFESWSLDSTAMTFDRNSTAVVDDSFSSPQWALCQRSATVYDHYYNFTGETFTRVRYDFIVRRKSTFYVINLIFPCATLSIIQLLVFIIPSTDSTSDRVGFGTTNLLTLVVFQTIVTAEMPKSSDAVTALSKYIIALILTSAVGIFQSVIIERMLRATTSAPPKWATNMTSFFPLLWSSQMPSGINQMILEGGSGAAGAVRPDKSVKKGIANALTGLMSTTNEAKQQHQQQNCSSSNNNNNNNNKETAERTERRPSLLYNGENNNSRLKTNNNDNNNKSKGQCCSKKEMVDQVFDIIDGFNISLPPSPIFERRIDEESAGRYSLDVCQLSPCIEQRSARQQPFDNIANGCVVGETPSNNNNKKLVSILKQPSSSKITRKPQPSSKNRKSSMSSSLASSSSKDADDDDDDGTDNECYDENAAQEEIIRVHINNGLKWGELITKCDHFTFLFCLALSLGSPIVLFIPLIIDREFHCELEL